jgi:hypothetical protein
MALSSPVVLLPRHKGFLVAGRALRRAGLPDLAIAPSFAALQQSIAAREDENTIVLNILSCERPAGCWGPAAVRGLTPRHDLAMKLTPQSLVISTVLRQ